MNFNTYYNLSYLLILFIVTTQPVFSEKLRGVTVEVTPYVYIKNNKFHGYCIDILNEISKIGGFNYSLYVAPDKLHGSVSPNGNINGMIAEIFNKAADFGIADLTVTEERSRYVVFTEPIMEVGVSALIHKTNAERIDKFADLAKQMGISYGTVNSGLLKKFSNKKDGYIQQMFYSMVQSNSIVPNRTYGIHLAKISKYAFIQESSVNEFIAANDCDLTSIRDYNPYFKATYAIALPPDSPHLYKFNHAIKLLKQDGVFDRLKAKYWQSHCSAANAVFSLYNYLVLFIFILLQFILF